MSSIANVDLYAALGLPGPQTGKIVRTEDIKEAARKMLLLYHPDKLTAASRKDQDSQIANAMTSEHQIELVYYARKILSDPRSRSDYDRELRLQQHGNLAVQTRSPQGCMSTHTAATVFTTGMEVVDLDDLAWNEEEQLWSRSCRCGNESGFEVTEAELIEESRDRRTAACMAEIVVGCRDCSLSIRVLFGLADERANDDITAV